MSHKYYYKSTPFNPHKIFSPNSIVSCPAYVITPNGSITLYSINSGISKTIIKDAPSSFYKTPTQQSGGNGSGTTVPNKYQIFINAMNKKIFNNEINSTNINTNITDVQRMIDMIKTEDKFYQTNPYYIAMMLLLRMMDYEYRIQILEEDIHNMNVQITNLTLQNNEYTTYCTCGGRNAAYTPGEQYGIVINTGISPAYIKYIELYGVPDDGIFLPSLLYQITIEYGY